MDFLLDLVPQATPQPQQQLAPKFPIYYSKSILHRESQYNFKGGSASCTYICLEASLYLLSGFVSHDSVAAEVLPLIKQILQTGIKHDKQVGFRSCDEVLSAVPRYGTALEKGNMIIGKLKEKGCFLKLLDNMRTKAQENNDPYQCVILTKPPETIMVFYHHESKDPHPFVIFDSHPRSFEKEKGAGFYFFKTEQQCNAHLQTVFKLDDFQIPSKESNEYLHWAERNMYEGTYVKFGAGITFDPTTGSVTKPAPVVTETPVIAPVVAPVVTNNAPTIASSQELENQKLVALLEAMRIRLAQEWEGKMNAMQKQHEQELAALRTTTTVAVTTPPQGESGLFAVIDKLEQENAGLKKQVQTLQDKLAQIATLSTQ